MYRKKLFCRIVILLLLIAAVAPLSLAEGSGHKVVYGRVTSQYGNPADEGDVTVYVNLLEHNWTCFTDTAVNPEDGTYSADLYTLQDINGANCRHLWKEGDNMFAWYEGNAGNITSIMCYGDPNCGGALELPEISFFESAEDIDSIGGEPSGTPVSPATGAEEDDEVQMIMSRVFESAADRIRIMNVTYSQDLGKNQLNFMVTLRNDMDKELDDMKIEVSLKDESGKLLLSPFAMVDMMGRQTKSFEVISTVGDIQPGFYYASVKLTYDREVLDIFGDWRVFVDDGSEAEDSSASPALEQPQEIEKEKQEQEMAALALLKFVFLVVLFLVIFYFFAHSVTYWLRNS
ncbi:hypothetical protein GF351_03150 [Candidatus Woesearchaeota archaeon]|nr:hypothetical protein [Candidatus Woesearchaeota archaeon]